MSAMQKVNDRTEARAVSGKLAVRLTIARLTMREQRRLLARARRLYVRLCRAAIKADPTGDILEYCAGRMLDSGMYAECVSRTHALHDVRYAILRGVWKLESEPGPRYGRVPSWHEWYFANGWAPHKWVRVKSVAA